MSAAQELRDAAAQLREFWPTSPVEPHIAGPLADWLDVFASEFTPEDDWTGQILAPALSIARLINGGGE